MAAITDAHGANRDTMYAVDPAQVRANATRMGTTDIVGKLEALGFNHYDLLVVSGGNPLLHQLDPLLDALPYARVHVETQGTKWKEWVNRCELVVVSPKPPSALGQHPADMGVGVAAAFMRKLTTRFAVKLVAFSENDLDWATACQKYLLHDRAFNSDRRWDLCEGWYLSACTAQTGEDLALNAVASYRWLANRAVERDDLAGFRIGLQQHVLAWPGERNR